MHPPNRAQRLRKLGAVTRSEAFHLGNYLRTLATGEQRERRATLVLKPMVAAGFASDGHFALMGESLAGLFVLETFLEEPAAFDDYVSVSPSLWWDGGRLARPGGRRVWIGFDRPAPPADQAARERALQDRVVSTYGRHRRAPGGAHCGSTKGTPASTTRRRCRRFASSIASRRRRGVDLRTRECRRLDHARDPGPNFLVLGAHNAG